MVVPPQSLLRGGHWWQTHPGDCLKVKKGKGLFYLVQYPVRWNAQSALHFTPGRPVHSDTNSASLGRILAMQQLCAKTIHSYFHRCLARYSFIELSELGCLREYSDNMHAFKICCSCVKLVTLTNLQSSSLINNYSNKYLRNTSKKVYVINSWIAQFIDFWKQSKFPQQNFTV